MPPQLPGRLAADNADLMWVSQATRNDHFIARLLEVNDYDALLRHIINIHLSMGALCGDIFNNGVSGGGGSASPY